MGSSNSLKFASEIKSRAKKPDKLRHAQIVTIRGGSSDPFYQKPSGKASAQ